MRFVSIKLSLLSILFFVSPKSQAAINEEFVNRIQKSPSLVLAFEMNHHLSLMSLACVASSVPLLATVIADSLPIVDVFTSTAGQMLSPDGNGQEGLGHPAAIAGGALSIVAGTLIVSPIKWLKGDKDGYYRYTKFCYGLTSHAAKALYGASSRCQTEFAKAMIIKSELLRRKSLKTQVKSEDARQRTGARVSY